MSFGCVYVVYTLFRQCVCLCHKLPTMPREPQAMSDVAEELLKTETAEKQTAEVEKELLETKCVNSLINEPNFKVKVNLISRS